MLAGMLMLLALLAAGPARAAESLGLTGEAALTGRAKVVDIACELTRDCPARCGDGKRLLGLKSSDGRLLLAAKDAGLFTGAVRDLLPSCGREVDVDGLVVTNHGARIFMLQRYRSDSGKSWIAANQTVIDWAKANRVRPGGPEADEWYRRDRTIRAAVAKKGRLGIPE